MSTIAATKKAEGNAFFAQKNYQKAIECYTEVRLLFLSCLLLIGCRPSITTPTTTFFTPIVLWHTLPLRSGPKPRPMVWPVLSVIRLSWRVITVLLTPWLTSYIVFIGCYCRVSLLKLKTFWIRVSSSMLMILTFLVFWKLLPPRYWIFTFYMPFPIVQDDICF